MPMAMLKLVPGVNVEITPSQLEAGYAVSNFGRFRSGLFEKLGGWIRYFNFAVGGIPRALHAWQDRNEVDYLAVGSTTLLGAIANNTLITLTPQIFTSSFNPNFSTTISSPNITVTDANIANVTVFDTVEFKTPVSVGGIILSGAYPIDLVLGTTQYRLVAASNATATRENLAISNITQANPGVVTYVGSDDITNGDLVYIFGVAGMTQVNGGLYTVAGLNTGANTFQLSGVNTTGFTAYTSAGTVSPGAVPKFTTTSGSASVSVTLQAHGLSAADVTVFPLSTTVGGVTIQGTYTVVSVTSANIFVISASTLASASTAAFMNTGQADIAYYIALGPVAASTGYSIGGYSSGGYSTGSSNASQTGTPITATDWTLDNWGDILLACPDGGGVYSWEPGTGFQNASLVSGAPIFNTGIFVAMQTQMLICIGSTDTHEIGVDQNPLRVRWSDVGDYTSFAISTTSQAGSRVLPNGSRIVGGLACPQQELIWTDLDLWAMNYLGSLAAGVWGFTKIGANAGLIARHATVQQGANVYWMGFSNFFVFGGGSPQPIPCSVWDVVFQDLNTTYQSKCWAWSNTPFNEVWFFFPRLSTSATECDCFVKINTLTGLWDYTPLDRTCGIDQSLLGMPISAASTGLIYEHEVSPDADGQAINSYFTTGWFPIAEGQDISFCDWFLPDMKWGNYNGAQTANIIVTFQSVYYAGDTPTTYDPFTVTQSTKYINPRVRGRLGRFKIESNDVGSSWRVGGCRFRFAADGRLP